MNYGRIFYAEKDGVKFQDGRTVLTRKSKCANLKSKGRASCSSNPENGQEPERNSKWKTNQK